MKRKRKQVIEAKSAVESDIGHKRNTKKRFKYRCQEATDICAETEATSARLRERDEDPVSNSELEIWAPHVRIQAPARRICKALLRQWSPHEEQRRLSAMKALRSKLVRLTTEHCGQGGAKPMVLTFERWLARAALRRDPATVVEPLIPADGFLDDAFVKDLARVMPIEQARSIAESLTAEGMKAATRLQLSGQATESIPRLGSKKIGSLKETRKKSKALLLKIRRAFRETRVQPMGPDALQAWSDFAKTAEQLKDIAFLGLGLASGKEPYFAASDVPEQTCKSAGSSHSDVQVKSGRQRSVMDVSLNDSKPYLTLSSAHYAKLQRLFNRHGPSGAGLNEFHDALFSCLARYEALKGAGYQCAVPGAAFDAVAKSLGPTLECFASPLNCRYERYCSAFGPLEWQFGSLGSFFDLDPHEGSFEANPPFVPEVMDAMLEHIEALLDSPERGALSFLVVIPAWGAGVKTQRRLEASKHARASVCIPAASHGFCDGAQHQFQGCSGASGGNQRSRHRPSSWDTAVTLLQNALGAARWPLSAEGLEAGFVAAMRAAAYGGPNLEDWERRGTAQGGAPKWKRRRQW